MADRKWRFTCGVDVLILAATDFYLEYRAEYNASSAPVYAVTLRDVWEEVNAALAPLYRRKAVEDRLKLLTWGFVGRIGTLEIDYGTDRSQSLSGITLKGVSPTLQNANGMIEYSLQFEYPIASGGVQIARTLQFGAKPLNGQNFICQYSKADETKFQPVFRAAPIRIPSGPPLKVLKVTAIKAAVAGATALARRQAAEAEMQSWAWDYVGNQGLLFIDGVNKGTYHLRAANPGDLSLPDAMTFDLEFVTGYGT